MSNCNPEATNPRSVDRAMEALHDRNEQLGEITDSLEKELVSVLHAIPELADEDSAKSAAPTCQLEGKLFVEIGSLDAVIERLAGIVGRLEISG